MKLLALDASTNICSVAVEVDGKIVERSKELSRSHSQHILPMIDSCLQESKINLSDLDACVFGKGPGSFTGLRLVASIIQAIAYSHSLPVVPISSLQAIAQTVYLQQGFEEVLLCEDARIKEVYWGDFQLVDGVMQSKTLEACSPTQNVIDYLISIDKSCWPVLVGSGWLVYPELTALSNQVSKRFTDQIPMSSGLLQLGQHYLILGQVVSAELALPSYLQMLQYQRTCTSLLENSTQNKA